MECNRNEGVGRGFVSPVWCKCDDACEMLLFRHRTLRHVRLAYQPPGSSTFLSEQISHQQPASSTFISEQISTSHQLPAKRTGCW
jgi:hypothetical protein